MSTGRIRPAHRATATQNPSLQEGPVTTDSTLTIDASAWMTMHRDRDTAHRMVMNLWGQLDRDQNKGARATASILWALRALDAEAGTGTVAVRSTLRPERIPPWVQSVTAAPTDVPTGTAELTVYLAAIYTPASSEVTDQMHQMLKAGANGQPRLAGQGLAYRRDPVPVPDDTLHEWVTKKLRRVGFEIAEVSKTVRSHASLRRRGGGYPVVTAHIAGTIEDHDAFDTAWRNGVGKGKSFGLGMLQQA